MLNAATWLVYKGRTSEHTTPSCFCSCTGYTSAALATRPAVNPVPAVCSGMPLCAHHITGVSDWQLASNIRSHRLRCIWHSNNAGVSECSAGVEQSATQTMADAFLLTFQQETKSHCFCQSFGWQKCGAVGADWQLNSQCEMSHFICDDVPLSSALDTQLFPGQVSPVSPLWMTLLLTILCCGFQAFCCRCLKEWRRCVMVFHQCVSRGGVVTSPDEMSSYHRCLLTYYNDALNLRRRFV